MSVISDRHTVVPFVAGKSAAMDGQRLAKVGYKTTKNKKAEFPSICVSVPLVQDSDILEKSEKLIPYVRNMLANVQDQIIRSLYESAHGSLASVADDEISVNACVNFLQAAEVSSRMTVESLGKWFDEFARDNLTVMIAEKLGFDLSTKEQEETVGKKVAGIRGLFTSMSAPVVVLPKNQADTLRKVIELANEEDDTSEKVLAKLKAMEEKQVELMDL